MAETTLTDNEYERLPSEIVVAEANQMIDATELQGERALAIAIALRDRIEALDECDRDPTSVILAGMVVDELWLANGWRIKQCVATLLIRSQAVSQQ